jgi:hypothetical protein
MTRGKKSAGSEGIRPRGTDAWEIRFEKPRGPDGRRKTETATIRGTLRDAQRERRRLMSAVDRGAHVDLNKVTVAEYASDRIETWHGTAQIGNRTTERYRYANKAYFTPYLGHVPVQKLTTIHMEKWHLALRNRGLDPRNIRHINSLLSKVLKDGIKHNLLVRNVAHEQIPPAGRPDEVEILRQDQIEPLLPDLTAIGFTRV